MIPVEVTTAPWHYTTFWDWLDHWQTGLAGAGAVLAAFLTILVTRRIANRQIAASREDANRVIAAARAQTEATVRLEWKRISSEDEAMRLSLALEIRHLVNIMIQTHEIFDLASRTGRYLEADDVGKAISRAEPIVFPALAGRFGLLGFPIAGHVLMFYANLKDIEHAGRMAANNPAAYVPPNDQRALMKLIEDACRQNVLPLLSELPQDENSPDTERKTKIEAMGALAAAERI